jgi:beta-xylosidase
MIISFIIALEVFAIQVLSAALAGRLVPSLAADFPDPSIIKAENAWYSLGTSSRGFNIQIARSGDFVHWVLLQKDAMPKIPAWVNAKSPQIWAPDVIQRV